MYVVGNLLLYYQEGDRSKSVSPDLMVVLGASKHIRSSYRLWRRSRRRRTSFWRSLRRVHTGSTKYFLMVVGIAALLVGCSSSDDDRSGELQRQLDMRADISPEDLAEIEEELEEFRMANAARAGSNDARAARTGAT